MMERHSRATDIRHYARSVFAYLSRESNPVRDFEEHTLKSWNSFDDGLEARMTNGAWYVETPLKFARGAVLGAGTGALVDAALQTGSTYAFYGAILGGLLDATQYQARGMINMIRAMR